MKKINSICFVSSYLPRQCGIATFTQSIVDYIKIPKEKVKIVAISDKKNFYIYGPEVIYEILTENEKTFIDAAKEINKNPDIDLVNIQHVFSLFGGKYGENILSFMERIKKPIITTFHMIYSKDLSPNKFEVVDSSYSKITSKIIELSRKIVVIIQPMADILIDQYNVDEEKIIIIPHGNPAVEKQNPIKYKKILGLGKGKIISSFGLIRPKKGLEYVIYAMPKILRKYPDAKFIILGESHPNRSTDYYNFLEKESKRINLLNRNIYFVNKFLSFKEVINYIFASDVFITPYLVPEQTSSGAIAYAMGCGKAIISTPFVYAKEVLAEKRGLFVNYSDPESIFKAVDFFFSYPKKRKRMETLAYNYAQKHSFKKIAQRYLEIFKETLQNDNLYL